MQVRAVSVFSAAAVLIAGGVVGGVTVANADPGVRAKGGPSCTGTYWVSKELLAEQQTLEGRLWTFTDGGQFIQAQPPVPEDPADPVSSSPAQGAWVATGKKQVDLTFVEMTLYSDGTDADVDVYYGPNRWDVRVKFSNDCRTLTSVTSQLRWYDARPVGPDLDPTNPAQGELQQGRADNVTFRGTVLAPGNVIP